MGAVKAPSALEWESLRLRVFSICKGANILKQDGKVLQVDQRRPAWAEDTQTQEVLVEGPCSEEPEGRWGFALCLETWTCAELCWESVGDGPGLGAQPWPHIVPIHDAGKKNTVGKHGLLHPEL